MKRYKPSSPTSAYSAGRENEAPDSPSISGSSYFLSICLQKKSLPISTHWASLTFSFNGKNKTAPSSQATHQPQAIGEWLLPSVPHFRATRLGHPAAFQGCPQETPWFSCPSFLPDWKNWKGTKEEVQRGGDGSLRVSPLRQRAFSESHPKPWHAPSWLRPSDPSGECKFHSAPMPYSYLPGTGSPT